MRLCPLYFTVLSFLAGLSKAQDAVNLSAINATITNLARQVMMQNFYLEEKVRSDGASGLKQVRLFKGGPSSYLNPGHSVRAVAAIHDHANFIDTIGIGEVDVVLYGMDFRTRHNDYKTVSPSKTSSDFHATEQIEFPDVPPSVLALQNPEDQVQEMKLWFKAFKEQNHTIRDYRDYFKPILCYLEGAWTTQTDSIQESFDSDRHHLEATSWLDLQEKVRFTSYTGTKDPLENYAYLPTTIYKVENGVPVYAQWNYRLLCHKLEKDLPLNRLKVREDLASRMLNDMPLDEYAKSRAARFQLGVEDSDEWIDKRVVGGLLDDLMYEIPGKDNYGAILRDKAFGVTNKEYNSATRLNAARYHRFFKCESGASGKGHRHRGYSDQNVFMAMTTKPEVAETCTKDVCQRWTYAIPMEIVYLTPLAKWNPYNITYKGQHSAEEGQTVRADGRNGDKIDPSLAYNGTNHRTFYQTPAEFFGSSEVVDTADTSSDFVGVLDKEGNLHLVGASGIRIEHNIPGVGYVRQRYPIMPVHGEGSTVWKEMEALRDMWIFSDKNILKLPKFQDTKFALGSGRNALQPHTHYFEVSAGNIKKIYNDPTAIIDLTTGPADDGHTHNISVHYNGTLHDKFKWQVSACDEKPSCGHLRYISPRNDLIHQMQLPF